MRHWIKRPLKAAWSRTSFIRRPVRARVDRFLHAAVVVPVTQGTTGPDRISNLELHAQAMSQRLELIQHDLNLTLNDLVREVTRLQIQLEAIEERIEAIGPSADAGVASQRRLAG